MPLALAHRSPVRGFGSASRRSPIPYTPEMDRFPAPIRKYLATNDLGFQAWTSPAVLRKRRCTPSRWFWTPSPDFLQVLVRAGSVTGIIVGRAKHRQPHAALFRVPPGSRTPGESPMLKPSRILAAALRLVASLPCAPAPAPAATTPVVVAVVATVLVVGAAARGAGVTAARGGV